jgi:hypothetical protein
MTIECIINVPKKCTIIGYGIAKLNPENYDRIECKDCSIYLICQSIKNTENVLESMQKQLDGDDGQSD